MSNQLPISISGSKIGGGASIGGGLLIEIIRYYHSDAKCTRHIRQVVLNQVSEEEQEPETYRSKKALLQRDLISTTPKCQTSLLIAKQNQCQALQT